MIVKYQIQLKVFGLNLRRDKMELSDEELSLCRQWFCMVQDLNPEILSEKDYKLAVKLKQHENYYISKEEAEIVGINWEKQYKEYKANAKDK